MKKKTQIMIVSLIVLFLGVAVAATTETEPVEREKAAMLSGNVIDAETDELISGAVVTLEEVEQETITDENGRFVFDVQAGVYTVSVKSEGYADHEEEITVSQEGAYIEFELVKEN